MSDPKNIDEAILEIQANLPTLVKDKDGQVGSQKTKYADLVQVNAVVLPQLNKLSIAYICVPNLQEDGKFALEYELLHLPSGTKRAGKYPLKLAEQPMQMGSAITYARRYALLAVLGIVAEDEDDDGRGAEDRQPRAQRQRPAQQQASKPRPETVQRASASSGTITEAQLGKLQALLREQGFETPADKRTFLESVVRHPLESTKALTTAEASAAIERLMKREQPPADVPASPDGQV